LVKLKVSAEDLEDPAKARLAASKTTKRREEKEECMRASDFEDLWVKYLQFVNAGVLRNEGWA